MYSSILFSTLLCANLAFGQNVVDSLSFGHKQGISSNSFSIPGWSTLGEGYVPQLLSDKVILTPPAGGMKRGAAWAEAKNPLSEWIIDFEFRAGGADRPGGNMQLWYVKDGQKTVSTSSLYTAQKFEGLALLVDAVGGVQKIRGFLNDGNIDFKSHPQVDSLAFGHCDYNYRNLGRPSKLQVKYGVAGLEVLIDGRQCFATSKIALPADYNFGVTAASSDKPDSFEVYKFAVSSGSGASMEHIQEGQMGSQQRLGSMDAPNVPASQFTSSAAQFEDLHNRLQQVSKSITNLFGEIQRHTRAEEERYQEILRRLSSSSGSPGGNFESRLNNMDRMISELHQDFRASDHKGQFEKINAQLIKTHEGVTEQIPGRLRDYVQHHTPRIGFIAFSFMAFQSVCLAVLMWQKYRKSTMPKKFL